MKNLVQHRNGKNTYNIIQLYDTKYMSNLLLRQGFIQAICCQLYDTRKLNLAIEF